MEGDAGSGQLNPTPPNTGDDAERSEAKEPVTVTRSDSSGDDAERSEAEEPAAEADADGGADPDAVEPDSAGAPSEVGEAVEGPAVACLPAIRGSVEFVARSSWSACLSPSVVVSRCGATCGMRLPTGPRPLLWPRPRTVLR